tara:strand:- start:96 stop:794 length:699 start_codon:yes stop_codon:yes gene_type:complete
MKNNQTVLTNILARGGIEFLAVLLGISASLWIDNKNKETELVQQRQEVYQLLKNQTEELLNYTTDKIENYEIQVSRFGRLIDQWETIKFDTVQDQEDYFWDIWASIKNSFYPDFTTYETLMNSGQINLLDFQTISYYGRLYRLMDDINAVQIKERGWRDFLEDYFMTKYANVFNQQVNIIKGLFKLFKASKNDPVVLAHLKSMSSIQNTRKVRVESFKQKLIQIQNHLKEFN